MVRETSELIYPQSLKLGAGPLANQPSLQVVELQQTLAQKDQVLGKLEQSLRLMEEASYDGTFLWKITNVTRRCHESVCGRTISLFSPGNSLWAQRLGGETGPSGPGGQERENSHAESGWSPCQSWGRYRLCSLNHDSASIATVLSPSWMTIALCKEAMG